MLTFPADCAEKLASAASLVHMMNLNTFTCGAFRFVEGTDLTDMAQQMKEHILARHWMCGIPDILVIYQLDDSTLLSVYGNADLISSFREYLEAACGSAALLYEESIT